MNSTPAKGRKVVPGTGTTSKSKSFNTSNINDQDQIPTMRTGGGLNSNNKKQVSPDKNDKSNNNNFNLANQTHQILPSIDANSDSADP